MKTQQTKKNNNITSEIEKQIGKSYLSSCTRVNYATTTCVNPDSLFERIKNATIRIDRDGKAY